MINWLQPLTQSFFICRKHFTAVFILHHTLPWRDAQLRCFLLRRLETRQLRRRVNIEPLRYNRLNLSFDPPRWRKMPHASASLMSGPARPILENLSLGVVVALGVILTPSWRTCAKCEPLRVKVLVTLNPDFWDQKQTSLTQHSNNIIADMLTFIEREQKHPLWQLIGDNVLIMRGDSVSIPVHDAVQCSAVTKGGKLGKELLHWGKSMVFVLRKKEKQWNESLSGS